METTLTVLVWVTETINRVTVARGVLRATPVNSKRSSTNDEEMRWSSSKLKGSIVGRS